MKILRLRLRFLSASCLHMTFSAVLLHAQQLPAGMKLEKVELQGSSLFTPAEITKMAGLSGGQNISAADMENAGRKLAGWGYFTAVRFAYKYVGTNLTLTFQVQEESKLLPCK